MMGMLGLRSTLAAALLLSACGGPTKHDVFLEGQKIEGEAERGPCKLHYSPEAQAAVINSEIVKTCLTETEKAIALYEQSQQMGYSGPDFDRVYERAKERRDRLQSMLKMVGTMEKEQDLEEAPHLR